MNPIIFSIAGSVIFGALGFFIGRTTAANKFKKEIDQIYEEVSEDLTKMKRELDEFHRVFVTSQEPEIAGEREKLWRKVSEDIRKGRKALAEETEKEESNDEPQKDTDEGISKVRDESERTNYQAITSTYSNDDEDDWKNPTKGIVRREADVTNGIYEIEEWEYREANEYPLEDVYYYETSTDVYTEDERMIDPEDIPSMLGYNQEELALRFLHEDEPQCIYIRNPEYEKVYCVYVCQGMGPDDRR